MYAGLPAARQTVSLYLYGRLFCLLAGCASVGGVVNAVGQDYIGVLVMGIFNAAIGREFIPPHLQSRILARFCCHQHVASTGNFHCRNIIIFVNFSEMIFTIVAFATLQSSFAETRCGTQSGLSSRCISRPDGLLMQCRQQRRQRCCVAGKVLGLYG